MDHRSVLRVTKYVNKGTLRLLAIAGMVTAACVAVTSCLGAVLIVRQLRLISAQRKALPVLQKAAEAYLAKNAPEELPDGGRRKVFRFPKAVPDAAAVEADPEADQDEDRQ